VTEGLLLIVSVTTVCMLSPGPDMVLVMRSTLTRDRRAGYLTSLGILSGNLVHISYCLLGLGVLIAHSIVAYGVLKLAGAAYLVYLGIRSIRSAGRSDASSAPAHGSDRGAFLEGLLNNLLNAKGALFYLGVFTQVIEPGAPPMRAAILVLAMVLTSAAFWAVFVATLHLRPVRGFFARFGAAVERAFGVLLIALGLRVATQD
jgi:RhtB (resistance to homoserine/threonine) family protein